MSTNKLKVISRGGRYQVITPNGELLQDIVAAGIHVNDNGTPVLTLGFADFDLDTKAEGDLPGTGLLGSYGLLPEDFEGEK